MSLRKGNKLTLIEVEILKQLCRDKSRREICADTGFTENTLDHMIRNIYNITGTNSLLSLYKYAIRRKLVKAPSPQ